MTTTRVLLCALALAAAAPGTAGAAPSFITSGACEEHQAIIPGDEDAVASRLPGGYSAERDQLTGEPLVFARAQHCDALTVDGATAPATIASWGVVVATPDGRGCGSGLPVVGPMKGDVPPACNWYTLGFATDSAALAAWLARSPGFAAVHVPGLLFTRDGDAFHFTGPGFSLDDVSHERPGEIGLRVGYWADSRRGTVKLAGSTDTVTGGAADSVVRAPAGSEMAALMGATEGRGAQPHAQFGLVRWSSGVFHRQTFGPPVRNERLDAFDGSCSFEGTVTFDPPAGNAEAPGHYDYAGAGTCTGTLNGRELTDAPANVRHAGPAAVSCVKAHTTAPGVGALTFQDGTAIGYAVDFTTTGTEVDFTVYGERSGTAPGHGSFLTPRTGPEVFQKCNDATLVETPLDVEFDTQAPLVASRRAPRLKLAVTPRAVRRGHRTRFTVRVAQRGGGPVGGAIVRLAGRRAQTDAEGRATVVARVRRAVVVRAAKPGFAPAEVVVRPRRARG
jgi:hypothetical protein